MRIAFYAPLKAPGHGTPSGDRRVAALYVQALVEAGHRVELASTFRSYDGAGSADRQRELRSQGLEIGRQLATQWRSAGKGDRPELWFTYHVYHKAPDWLGPQVSAALGIPYVIAEASYAPKRAGGAWAIGHEGAGAAIRHADLLVCPTRFDMPCLEAIVADSDRMLLLPPFLDARPFAEAVQTRAAHRARLALKHQANPDDPWIAVAAMMRAGDKAMSYHQLAAVLALISDLRWQLLIAGDGPSRDEVARELEAAAPGRTRLLGTLDAGQVAGMYAASDLCIWPAANEAYGMAMLEAQAAGLPVVSCLHRGVPDVVLDGRTGLLVPAADVEALASRARALLLDPERRAAMGRAAAQYVAGERSLGAAAQRLGQALARARDRFAAHHLAAGAN